MLPCEWPLNTDASITSFRSDAAFLERSGTDHVSAVCGGASSAFLCAAQGGLHLLHLVLQHLFLLNQLLASVRESTKAVTRHQLATTGDTCAPCTACKAVSHFGLVAQLLVLLCQLLMTVLHALQHLLHLLHLLLEPLVAHLEVSHTVDELRRLADAASTGAANV